MKEVLRALDKWCVDNQSSLPAHVKLHVVGQTALLEANLSIEVVATVDVDLKFQIDYHIKKKLEELLAAEGKVLDPVGHEAWMPEETEYISLFKGERVEAYIAKPVYVILSKAKYAPYKNRQLIIDYLASDDLNPLLFDLAKKYEVELASIV